MGKIKKIDPAILYQIIVNGSYDKKEIHGYKWVERTITGSDYDDGGTDYDLVIQEVKSGKYYAVSYCEWDIENTDFDEETGKIEDGCDLPDEIEEVKPKQKTITIYE